MIELIIQMLTEQPLWGLLTLAVFVWYCTITIYVAARGLVDLLGMFGRLGQRQIRQDQSDA